MIQQFHFWIFIWRKQKDKFEKIHASHDRATLFTIAKTWKQPKSLLMDEWIKKLWYIDTVEYYSALK